MQLEFENLTVRYGEREALKPFNACLREGGLIGLIGPNGAGKSTLLRCTATLLRPSAGRLYLDGADVTRQPALLRCVLGYLPQEPALYPELTPREFLAYMAAVRGLPRHSPQEYYRLAKYLPQIFAENHDKPDRAEDLTVMDFAG